MSNFKINLGVPYDQYILPSVEDCLRKYDASFYSTQNAVRIHEWMGDAEALPLLLTKVDSGEEVDIITKDVYHQLVKKYHLELGNHVFLTKGFLTSILPIHQIAYALPELIAHEGNPNNTPEHETFIQDNLRVMACHTATAIFHQVYIPARLNYISPDVLLLVLAAVITQRGKAAYAPKEVVTTTPYSEADVNRMRVAFNVLTTYLDRNIFEDIDVLVNQHQGITADDFRQVAMAMSTVMKCKFPVSYYANTELTRYKQMVTLLNQVKDENSSFVPTPQKLRSHLRSVK